MTGPVTPGRGSPVEQDRGQKRHDPSAGRAVADTHPDRSLILAHGARSLLVTALVLVTAPVAMAIAPPVATSWPLAAGAYVLFALLAWVRSRNAASGGVVPLGALGDSRFILALVATAGLTIPTHFVDDAPLQVLMLAASSFVLLVIAAALCGASDGAWTGAAMRHLRLPLLPTLAAFMRASRSPGACSWRIVTPPAPGPAPPPAPASPPALPWPPEQIHQDPSLVVTHGARSTLLTVMVLAMGIVSFALAPPLDRSWALITGGYPALAAVSFLVVRARPATVTIPIGAHGDTRALLALVAMALFIVVPDGRVDDLIASLPPDPSFPPIEEGPPFWLVPAAAEAVTLGLAPPVAFSLLLAASLVCGMADGAWIAMTMRHLRLSFRQALAALLRGAWSGATRSGRMVEPGSGSEGP